MKAAGFFYRYPGIGSLLATVTNAVAIFVVFRIGYRVLGPSVVGMWALIQGIMFLSRIADSGSSGNITRLVSIDCAKQGSVRLKNFILTGLLAGTAPILVLGGLIFLPVLYYLRANYAHMLDDAIILNLLVCSLAFGVFISAAMIIAACLDGLGLMALRGYLSCFANLLFIPITLVCVHALGDVGLGAAYVAYAMLLGTVLAVGLSVFRPHVASDYVKQSVRELSRKTIRFNLSFLLTSLCQVLMDPACKLLIGHFATLDAVAIFDLANKVASQARILFQATLQSVLPMLSREAIVIDPQMHEKLVRWNGVVARWSFTTMALIMLASGFLSQFSLGRISEPFILNLLLLSFGNAINAIGLVGYYADVGSGHLRRLMGIFAGAAMGNVFIGAGLGYLLGERGVVIALALSVAWAGLGFSRAVLGRIHEIILMLPKKIAPELLLFAFSSLTAWSVMVAIPNATLLLRIVATGAMALIVIGTFLYRERERVYSYGSRLVSLVPRSRSG